MSAKSWTLVGAAALASTMVAAGAVRACDRPGTPDVTQAQAIDPHTVKFSWRNTVYKGLNPHGVQSQGDIPGNIWNDIYIRANNNENIGRDLTGQGPYSVTYDEMSSYTFGGLSPGTKYCIAIRARTGPHTSGCVSAVTSAWACTTTPPLGTPAVRQPAPAPQNISVSGQGTFTVTGGGFAPGHFVTLRSIGVPNLTPLYLTNISRADNAGRISFKTPAICGGSAGVDLSVTDGRVDGRNTPIYSNVVLGKCH
jgi:hypothetical protein